MIKFVYRYSDWTNLSIYKSIWFANFHCHFLVWYVVACWILVFQICWFGLCWDVIYVQVNFFSILNKQTTVIMRMCETVFWTRYLYKSFDKLLYESNLSHKVNNHRLSTFKYFSLTMVFTNHSLIINQITLPVYTCLTYTTQMAKSVVL